MSNGSLSRESQIVLHSAAPQLPALIERAGEGAAWRFLEFFTVNIRNKNTRAAYGQATVAFLRWCEGRGIMRIEDVRPVHVAGYIEQMLATRKAPTVKQHLACIRMLFDWLVTGQVLPSNPAHAVRGPRHSVIRGATAVMSSQETSEFLKKDRYGACGGPARPSLYQRHGLRLRAGFRRGESEGGGLFSAPETMAAAPQREGRQGQRNGLPP
jgi:site-specific recombinase XerD